MAVKYICDVCGTEDEMSLNTLEIDCGSVELYELIDVCCTCANKANRLFENRDKLKKIILKEK